MTSAPFTTRTGPLRVATGAKGDDAQYIFGPLGQIATVHAHAKPGDAHLLAASADLLEALLAARTFTKHVPLSHGRRRLEAMMDAAIAKTALPVSP